MKSKILLIFSLIFITPDLFYPADTSGDDKAVLLSLDQAWDLMLESNGTLHKLHTEWGAARRKAGAYDQWIPSLSAGASLNRASPLISRYTMPSESEQVESDFWSLRATLNMQLKIAPGLSIEEELRQLRADLLDLEIAKTVRSFRYDLTILYYEILAGENRIALQQESLNLAKSRLRQTELQFEQGVKSDLELLSARIAVARDIPALQKEEANQEKRYITLRNYLGLEDSAVVKLTPVSLKEGGIPESEAVLSSIPVNPDMLILENRIRQAELQYRQSVKEGRGPSLGMSMGWSSSLDPAFEKESWTSEEWRDNLSLGLSLTLPLDSYIRGSSDQLSLKELEEDIEAARITLDDAGRALRDEVRTLYLDIELSRSNIEMNELNVSLLTQNANKMEQNYNNGRVPLRDLDESRQELKEALLALEDEKLKLTTLTVELLTLLGLEW